MKVCEHLRKLDVEANIEKLEELFLQDSRLEESIVFGSRTSDEAWICLDVSNYLI